MQIAQNAPPAELVVARQVRRRIRQRFAALRRLRHAPLYVVKEPSRRGSYWHLADIARRVGDVRL
jgi:hypothetical protein